MTIYEVAATLATIDNEMGMISERQIRNWLASEHHGDCTQEAETCVRCWAERSVVDARYLATRLGIKVQP